jgi:2,5-dihydroxypyridine 5,6-dioxygenase
MTRTWSSGELFSLFQKEFQLCALKPGEVVAVVSESGTRPEYVEASLGAARALGAHAFHLALPQTPRQDLPFVYEEPAAPNSRSGLAVAVHALKEADLVIDLTVEGLIHAPERGQILSSRARMLTIIEPPDVLLRCFPRPDLRRRVERAAHLLQQSRTMRVRSDAGTDLTMAVAGAPVITQYGYTDQPRRWDHWPSGLVAVYPIEGSVTGTVVLDVGDIVFPFKRYIQSPVTLVIREGFITEILGDGLDADLLRDYFACWRDPEAYATSHMGWGLDETARWNALAFYDKEEIVGVEPRSFYGNFLFSTGPNRYANRFTKCHLDIPMRHCTIFLDEKPIIERGEIIHPEMAVRL